MLDADLTTEQKNDDCFFTTTTITTRNWNDNQNNNNKTKAANNPPKNDFFDKNNSKINKTFTKQQWNQTSKKSNRPIDNLTNDDDDYFFSTKKTFSWTWRKRRKNAQPEQNAQLQSYQTTQLVLRPKELFFWSIEARKSNFEFIDFRKKIWNDLKLLENESENGNYIAHST